MATLVVLDDSTIMSMLGDSAFATQFPCLFNKRDIFKSASAAGCGMCAKKRQERQRKEMAAIKACLAGMSTEQKAALKQRLAAEKIRIVYTNLAGQVVQLTF
jgi:hypothetical protein